jgi:hypothetical protein
MLFINGSLPTVSIWRMWEDTINDYAFVTHSERWMKEVNLMYISDGAKKRIIEEYLEDVFESEYKEQLLNMEVRGVNGRIGLKRYLREKNR